MATIGLRVKSWDKNWSGPSTVLLTGKPCEVQFVNCTPDARVYDSKPGTDPGGGTPQVRVNAKHDAFKVGDLPAEYA